MSDWTNQKMDDCRRAALNLTGDTDGVCDGVEQILFPSSSRDTVCFLQQRSHQTEFDTRQTKVC